MLTADEKPAAIGFGILMLIIGALSLLFVSNIRKTRISDRSDPGPRAFPMILGIALVGGGIGLVTHGIYRTRRLRDLSGTPRPVGGEPVKHKISAFMLLILVLGIGVYLALIPTLGFFISSTVFAITLMHILHMRLLQALLVCAGMMLAIYFLFVRLFGVMLPTAPGNLPF